jgi:hypothetical protein
VCPATNGDCSPRQRTVAVASPGSIEGTSSEILLFRLSIRTWRKLPRVCQRPLAQPAHEVQDHRVADRRAGGRKAAKLAPRPALKWCSDDQPLEPSCHHGHRRPGGSDSQPPGEGRPVFLPVTAPARRSVRIQRQANRPYCLPLVPGTRADEAPASAPTSRQELRPQNSGGDRDCTFDAY